jgi:Ca-activated chloride channel family protein
MREKMMMMVLVLVLSLMACSSSEDMKRTAADEGTADQAASTKTKQKSANENISYDTTEESKAESPIPMMAPPNGEEYDDMYFKHYGTNPFVSTEDDPLSTFAIDVDTGSYTVTRNYIQRGSLPPEEAVRVEEFINYFTSKNTSPKDDTFDIHVDGGDSPFGEGYKLLRINIKGKEINVEDRKDAHLTFVIDVSGSMDQENRLGLVKKSLRLLVEQLGNQDKVGIVVYGSQGRMVLEPTSIDEKQKILAAIEELQTEGSTNAEEGLAIGYAMASEYFKEGAINRVILASDGVANVGDTSANGILQTVKEYAQDDISLSTFGFGMGNYNDVLMEQLANKGNGNYSYIDTFSEARRIFTEELTGTLQTIAKDAKIQVAFNSEKVERYRLLGYENRDLKDEDFQNDDVDAGEVGSGHSVTALYEIKVQGEDVQDLGEVRIRFENVASGEVEEIKAPLVIGNTLAADLKFIASVAEFAEILRGSYWAKEGSLLDVLELAEETARGEGQLEFVGLVKDTIALRKTAD